MKKYLVIATVFSIFVIHVSLYFDFTIDDAYINFRYANNWAKGHGFVYNTNQHPAEGYNNFLWELFLGILSRFGVPPPFSAKILGITFSLLTLLVLYHFNSFIPLQKNSHSLAFFAPLILATNSYFAIATVEGLETSLFVLLTLLTLLFYIKEYNSHSIRPLSSFFMGLMLLTRPDASLLILFLLAIRLFRIGFTKYYSKGPPVRTDLKWLLASIVILAVMYIPYFSWRYHFYGYLFPNTYYVKLAPANSYDTIQGIKKTFSYINCIGGMALFSFVLISLLFVKNSSVWVILIGSVMCRFFFQIITGGEKMGLYRFLIPTLPILLILVQYSLVGIFNTFQLLPIHPNKIRIVRSFIVALFIFINLQSCRNIYLYYAKKYSSWMRETEYIGRWLRANSKGDEVLVLGDAGVMPYYSDLTTVDLYGLNDEHIAHLPGRYAHKIDTDYVFAKNPSFIVLRTSSSWPSQDYNLIGGTEMDRTIERDTRFKSQYEFLFEKRIMDEYYLSVFKKIPMKPSA